MPLLGPKIEAALRTLCERFRVERLYLFGSAAEGRFDIAQSDYDFLVTLQNAPPGEYADNYLGLANALESLLQRPVDLVTEASMRNPFFKETVVASRKLLYDASQLKAAA